MGLVDAFRFGGIKCPWCKKEDTFEAQTKDFDGLIGNYKLGQKVDLPFELRGEITLKKLRVYHKCGPLIKRMCICSNEREEQDSRCFEVDVIIRNKKFAEVIIGKKIDLEKEREIQEKEWKKWSME